MIIGTFGVYDGENWIESFEKMFSSEGEMLVWKFSQNHGHPFLSVKLESKRVLTETTEEVRNEHQ
jgi:hypothetical protein